MNLKHSERSTSAGSSVLVSDARASASDAGMEGPSPVPVLRRRCAAGARSEKDVVALHICERPIGGEAAKSTDEAPARMETVVRYFDKATLKDFLFVQEKLDDGCLQKFVRAGVPWCHIDLAGPAAAGGLAHISADARGDFTGFGVRAAVWAVCEQWEGLAGEA